MKIRKFKPVVYSLIILGALSHTAYAHYQRQVDQYQMGLAPGKFYVGAFGGGGQVNQLNVSQFGTAYYFEVLGGPLAVNAFGHTKNQSTWLVGGQVGYQAQEMIVNSPIQWVLVPATELEGFYLGKQTFKGSLSNNTARLPEHNFAVSYPTDGGVFLANVVFNFKHPSLVVHPYVGLGFGGAILDIQGADALQVSPTEAGVNHYNSRTSDTVSTFAGQAKAGLSYDINSCVTLFAEYRFLYLASTHYTFGSTVYPQLSHPETSPWLVKFNHQNYNLGTVGIRVNL